MSDEKKTHRILSIDPGLSVTGWAISDIDNGRMTVVQHGEIVAQKEMKNHKEEINIFGKRLFTLDYIEEQTDELVKKYNPTDVVSEDAFWNPKFPDAFMAICLCIFTMARIIKKQHSLILHKLAPRLVKNLATGNGNADKTKVKSSITSNPAIIISKPELLSEHESDAIAIGYAFALNNYWIN